MRKFWLLLLSLGLIMAFTVPVFAADVKFSGSYVAQGYYENNRKLADPEGASLSNVWQRLRIGTVFQVAEGLKLTTRFDAMEKVWGAARQTATPSSDSGVPTAENDNLKFENAFLTFAIPIGTIEAGYMNRGAWGTVFGNSSETDNGPRVRYTLTSGPFILQLVYDKVEGKKDYSTTGPAGAPARTDHDSEKFNLYATYKWNAGETGVQLQYNLDSSTADNPATGYRAKNYAINPYAKAKFGPVYVEAEFGFALGKYQEYLTTTASQQDVDLSAWRGYIMANVDIAPAYVGAVAFYASGDDKTTTDKMEGSVKTGADFSPCLILMNYDLGRWNGVLGNANNSVNVTNNIDNVFGGQIFAGIKPITKLDVKLSLTTAKLNKEPSATTTLVSKQLGYEADVTAAYKIYDNLQYMIGAGYLWAGDAFKGTSEANKAKNDYILTHKLTLTF